METIYELISEPISEWLKEYNIFISKEIVFILLIIIGFLLWYLITVSFSHINKIIKEKKSKSLHPFFNYEEISNARKNYITQNFQNVPPSKEDELIYTHSSVAKQKLIKFFLNSFSDKSDKRFFILLADSGMGKTTFSLSLYRKYNSFYRFFLKKNKYDIALIPLGYDNADEHINDLKQNNSHLKTILVLDALDEDNNAIINSNNRIQNLIELTKEFRFVIITCRTQFFNNEKLEPKATNIPRLGTKKGYYSFEKLYLSPFSDKDVNDYINKKYGVLNLFHPKKKKAKEIIKNSPYLMARPMLLDFIEDIVDSNKDFDYTFNIYESLIDSWLERETFNVPANKKFTYKNDLLKFSTEIAKKIYNKRKQLGYTINQIEFEEIARINNLDLSSFEMKARSLLNRNPEGDFKFSHKSILEYFLAKEIYKDVAFKKFFDEEGMDMTISFYDELCYINDYLPYVSSGKFNKNITIYDNTNSIKNIQIKSDLLNITKIVLDNFNETNLRAIRSFKNINQLEIKSSKIESLDDINSFQNLTEITIQNSDVKDFKRISLISSLLKLSLININLFDFQKNEISWDKLNNLNYLNLSQNSISSIFGLEKARNIKILIVSKNKIPDIEIPNNIEVLDLSYNKLSKLDFTPIQLKDLNASFNQIDTFILQKNRSLNSIDLSNNNLKKLIFDTENSIEKLILSNCKLDDEIIVNIRNCSNIIELHINDNNIHKIAFIIELKNLKLLNITKTLIDKITIEDIPNSLKEIHISKNLELVDKMNIFFKLSEDGKYLKRN